MTGGCDRRNWCSVRPCDRLQVIVALALAAGSLISAAAAAPPPQWGALEPGPYAVGYRTIEHVDVSRRYGDRPRTLLVSVWFPADVSRGGTPMPYRGYLDDVAREWGGARAEELRAAAIGDLTGAALGSVESDGARAERLATLLETPTAAIRDAAPASGRFPLVLHVPGALTQSILLEYLASQGYVVMSVPLYNSAPAYLGRGDHSPASLLDTTEDLACVLDEAARVPFADVSRTAAIGMFAQAGLALQMRGAPLAAVACLECGDSATLTSLPFHDPSRVRIPVLELRSATAGGAMSFTTGLRAATRYAARFTVLQHSDFFPFATLAAPRGHTSGYEAVVLLARQFLDSALKGDEAATRLPPRRAATSRGFRRVRSRCAITDAEVVPPTTAEFLGWLRFGDIERARAAWDHYGAALTSRDRMFAVVLFLARDRAPHAAQAAAMFRRGFPVGDDARRREQEAMLTRLLGEGKAP